MADNPQEIQLMIHLINNIREFDGKNSAELPDFIRQTEKLLPSLERFNATNKAILFDFILAKCTGNTIHAIHNAGNINTWITLKNLLKTKFGEKTSISELVDELKTVQIDGTIEHFYFKIQKLCNRISNRRLTHDEIGHSAQEIQRVALNVFKQHLPEPTKSILLARNPNDIDEAYNIVLEARHQFHTKHTTYNLTTRTNFNNNFRNEKPNMRYQYNRQNEINRTNFRNNFRNEKPDLGNQNYRQNEGYRHNNRYNYNNYNNDRRINNYDNRSNNNYNNNHSSQSRRTNNNYSSQTRRTSSVEPMEISHAGTNFQNRSLPYIVFKRPEKTFYLLIDSGAEFSIINKGVFSPNFRREVSTNIKTFGNISEVKNAYKVPLFEEFNQPNIEIEFLEHNLHNKFDGLIGNNILEKLKCTIDYPNRKLRTPYSIIPLFLNKEEEIYHEKVHENHCLQISNLHIDIDKETLPSINNNLNNEEKNKLMSVLKQNRDIFYNQNSDLTFTNEIKHKINTTNDVAIYSKTYRYPQIHTEEVNRQIEEMLEQGIIRHSNSPYNSPIWVVPKKLDNSGKQKWRIVIDFRKLNLVTIEDRYPIPNIEDILNKLGRAQYFTTLDLAKGFHQIEVDPNDIHKTAFSTANGHYEFLRMPFGLKNAPATFQRMMNNVLKDYIGKICLVYMDDIIVFSTSIEEHIDSLKKVFSLLKKAKLKIQIDKCKFMSKETEFLGHIITPEGIKTNPNKVSAIQKIKLPRTQKEIKSFLGITGYYRKFIKDYSKIAHHIVKYLKKNSKIKTDDRDYVASFEKLKKLLINDPILIHPNFTKLFTLTTDASNFALGAVLTQCNKPVAYASRSLNDHEKHYSVIEKELLAIVWATKYFRPYLFGRKFLLKTDHRPLVWLNGLKEPNSKLQRWKIKLNEFDFDIEYIKGKENIVADGLSRINSSVEDKKENDSVRVVTKADIHINANEIDDVDMISIEERNINNDFETVHSADTDGTDFIKNTQKPLNFFKNQIIFNTAKRQFIRKQIIFGNKTRQIVSVTNSSNLMETFKNILPTIGLVALYVENDHLFARIQDVYRTYFSRNTKLMVFRTNKLLADITDKEVLLQEIEKSHLENNHRGISEIFNVLRAMIYHPHLKNEIHKYINNCDICNAAKYDRKPIQHPLNLTKTPILHNEIVHFDIWYPQRNVMVLTSIDRLTKYATAQPLQDRTWLSLINAIRHRIQYLGKPKLIITDNELDVVNIKQFFNTNNIQVHFTTSYNKTGNADVERLHSTLNEHIRLFNADPNKSQWSMEDKIFTAITAYNNSIHTTHKRKPIDFINNVMSQEELKNISDYIHNKKQALIGKENSKRNHRNQNNYKNNYVRNFRASKAQPKYIKLDNVVHENNYLVTQKNNKERKYYKNQIKRKYKYQN